MTRKIWIFVIISLFAFALTACQSGKQAQQPAGGEAIKGSSSGASAVQSEQNPADMAAQTSPATVSSDVPAKSCKDECSSITAFCQADTFYACIQEGECKVIKTIEACGGECINTMFCSAEGKNRGIITLSVLLNANPYLKGNVGEEFSLATNVGRANGDMKCSIGKIVQGQAIMICSRV